MIRRRGKGRGRGRGSFSRPTKDSSPVGATKKIAKKSLGTHSSGRLASDCEKNPMPLAESSSSSHPREANANKVESPNAKLEELHSSGENDLLRFEAELFDYLQSSGESRPRSAAPSSIAHTGGPTPTRPALSAVLTQMVNKFHHDPSDEPEVESAPSLVRVGKYSVKEASAGVLADIINKHGDIAAKCPLKNKSRQLEIVCDIVRELRDRDFTSMSLEGIKKSIDDVADLKVLKVDVDWLLERLEGIHNAKLVVGDMLSLKNNKNRLEQERDEAKEKRDSEDAKMRRAQAKIDGIMESAWKAKSVVERYAEKGSMLDGLL